MSVVSSGMGNADMRMHWGQDCGDDDSEECIDSPDSSRGETGVEAKLEVRGIRELNQVIRHSVVMSFIHHGRHTLQNTLVPAVGITGRTGSLCVRLYDCEADVLLHLQPTDWITIGVSGTELCLRALQTWCQTVSLPFTTTTTRFW